MHMRLAPTFETEVYVNGRGYLTIEQFDGRGDSSRIELSPDQARHVLKAISALLKGQKQWWPGAVDICGSDKD